MKSEMDRNARTKKQVLNLIYFFDGGKTRNLKISVSAVKGILFALALLMLWSIFGSVFFVRNLLYTKQVSNQLHAAMDTLFEYQVKYESVLDNVYKTDKKHKEPETENVEIAKTSSIEAPKENISHAPHVVDARPVTNDINMLLSKHFEISTGTEENSVNVESPSISHHDRNLNVSIALRNKGQARADGLLWAVAEWKDAQGTSFTTRSPDAMKGKHAPDRPEGNTFSIRQYKVKGLNFPIPENARSLSKIDIWLMDRKSKRSRFEIRASN